jgi:hypothetical protein
MRGMRPVFPTISSITCSSERMPVLVSSEHVPITPTPSLFVRRLYTFCLALKPLRSCGIARCDCHRVSLMPNDPMPSDRDPAAVTSTLLSPLQVSWSSALARFTCAKARACGANQCSWCAFLPAPGPSICPDLQSILPIKAPRSPVTTCAKGKKS